MSKAPRLTKAKFLLAMRRLKSGHSLEDIAADMGIKPSTVKSIRQAKTWPEYERRKVAKAQAIKMHKAKRQPVTRKTATEDISSLIARVNFIEKWIEARQKMELEEVLEKRPRRFGWRRAR